MSEDKKSYLLLAAAAFVILALLAVFRIIDMPGISGLPATTAVFTSSTGVKHADSFAEDAPVNINTATAEELMTLDEIGEKRAADIIEYRETHGKFHSADDLTLVEGIGDQTVELNRERIIV